MRTITRSTVRLAPPDVIWPAVVASPDAFVFVTRGLIRYTAVR